MAGQPGFQAYGTSPAFIPPSAIYYPNSGNDSDRRPLQQQHPYGPYGQPPPNGSLPPGAYQLAPSAPLPPGAYQLPPNTPLPPGTYQLQPNAPLPPGAYQFPPNAPPAGYQYTPVYQYGPQPAYGHRPMSPQYSYGQQSSRRTRQEDTMKNIGLGALLGSLLCCCCFADDVLDSDCHHSDCCD